MGVFSNSMWIRCCRVTRLSTSNTLSPSLKVTVVVAKITPSDGTIAFFSSFNRFMLFRMVSHRMDRVQVSFLLSSTVASSGSTGVGFPSGTGSVWYLSFPVSGSISIPGVEEEGAWEESVVPLSLDAGLSVEGVLDGVSAAGEEELLSCGVSLGAALLSVWLPSADTVLPAPPSAEDELMEVSAVGILLFGVGWSRNAAAKTATTHTTASPIFACLVLKNCLIFSFMRCFLKFLEIPESPAAHSTPLGSGAEPDGFLSDPVISLSFSFCQARPAPPASIGIL